MVVCGVGKFLALSNMSFPDLLTHVVREMQGPQNFEISKEIVKVIAFFVKERLLKDNQQLVI